MRTIQEIEAQRAQVQEQLQTLRLQVQAAEARAADAEAALGEMAAIRKNQEFGQWMMHSALTEARCHGINVHFE